MSGAISLLSVLAGARPGDQSARGAAASGFAALFPGGGAGGAAEGGGPEVEAGAAALKKMYSFLAGLARKAAFLGQPGDDPAATLKQVAALATDLATALAEVDRTTGQGLLQALQASLREGGDAEIALTAAPAGDAEQGAAEAPDTPVDPAAAVQALQSVIAGVMSALRGLQVAAQPQQGQAPARAAQVLAVTPQAAVQDAPAAPTVPEAAAAAEGAAMAARPMARGSVAPVAEPEAAPVAPEAAVSQPVSAEAAEEAAPAPIFLLPPTAGREDSRSGASQALMARIVAAAAAAPEAAANVVQAAPSAVPDGVTAPDRRRAGPMERLITPEDIARALAREGQAGRHPAVAAARPHADDAGAQAPRFAAALADQVRSAEVSEGRTRIELSPRGLGSIEVDVSTRDDGTLKVVVRAENPAVLNSLRDERDLLAQALGGLDTGSLDLQSFSDGSGQDAQGERRGGPTLSGGEDRAGTGGDGAATPVATIGAGRLDIVT